MLKVGRKKYVYVQTLNRTFCFTPKWSEERVILCASSKKPFKREIYIERNRVTETCGTESKSQERNIYISGLATM